MESFERGQHVIVTGHDEKIAGHLMEILDDGYVVIVTHRMLPVVKDLPDSVCKVIRSVVEGMPAWRLKVTAALNRVGGWRGMDLEELREVAVTLIERETLAAVPDEVRLQEIAVPITTFINGGEVRTIESTLDVNTDYKVAQAVAVFGAGMDAEIEQLLTEADVAKTKEKEEDGNVQAESGTEEPAGSS